MPLPLLSGAPPSLLMARWIVSGTGCMYRCEVITEACPAIACIVNASAPAAPSGRHLGLKRRHSSRAGAGLSRFASGRLSRRRWPRAEAGFTDRLGRQPSLEFQQRPSTAESKLKKSTKDGSSSAEADQLKLIIGSVKINQNPSDLLRITPFPQLTDQP